MHRKLRFLLLQVRDDDDPIREQEVHAFARALQVDAGHLVAFDLLAGIPARQQLDAADVVLLGGSGNYYVSSEGDWLHRALDGLRELHALGKPTFASCWGFQALARALGGKVMNDIERAELGTQQLHLTAAGLQDPVFGPLGENFLAQMGHEDCVVELPPGVTLLASSSQVENQAYRCDGLPIYATQFHPELNRRDLLGRVRAYPQYVEKIAGMTIERFIDSCLDTPDSEAVLRRFVEYVFPT